MDNTAVIKITYKTCTRRLKYQQKECNGLLQWSPDLSFETLHFRIEELFQIPSTERLLVTYTDIDNDVITMSNSDDVQDVIEGRSISSSMNPVRLKVSLMQSETRSVGGAPCDHLAVYVGQMILPASITQWNLSYSSHDLRMKLRILSYSMLRHSKLNQNTDLEVMTKLLKLHEASKWSASPIQIPVDLIDNLLYRIAKVYPVLIELQHQVRA